MKRDLLTSILALILLAASLAAAGTCYKFWRASQEHRALQGVVSQVGQRKALINSFAIELNEYSLRNPAITPMLEQLNLRLRLTTNTVSASR